MQHRTPVSFHCPACDAESVARGATATWDRDAQSWKLSDDLEPTMFCGDCGEEFAEPTERKIHLKD